MVKLFPYKSILIACSVNTARSPMACGWLRDYFSKNNIETKVRSCGISSNARDGMLISRDAIDAMREIGIKLSEESISMDLKKHSDFSAQPDGSFSLNYLYTSSNFHLFYLPSNTLLYFLHGMHTPIPPHTVTLLLHYTFY